jgi:protein phosphatase 2C-like protein
VDGELVAATTPQNGEYANETFFLTSGDGAPRYTATLPPACAIALLTDGLLPLAVDLRDCRPHAPFFDPLFAFAAARGAGRGADAELAAFLESDRVAARTDDDTTLVLAVRRSALTPRRGPEGARPLRRARGARSVVSPRPSQWERGQGVRETP